MNRSFGNMKWMLFMMLAVPGVVVAQSGSDINQAIPIYFGQTINDTVDKNTRPNLVYSITLAKGQQLTATAITNASKFWALCLASPTSVNVDRAQCVANSGSLQGSFIFTSLSFNYQAAASGTYYLIVEAGGSGIAFQLQVTAQGTPIITPNPTLSGCVTGQVDYITYSLQLIAAILPDEVSIGGTRLCPACTVKPPAYPLLVSKMETAMSLNVGVSACYDAAGNIFQLKLTHP